jgi:hypothetical protein
MPALAHGEQLLVILGLGVYVLPGLVLLFVPWHAWWARLLVASILAAGVFILWSTVLPGIAKARMSSLVEWSILLSPSLIALILAVLLRVYATPRGLTHR